MWKLVKLGFGLLFLAIAIHGNETLEQQKVALKNKLDNMAENNESIHGKIKPFKDGLLGEGLFGVVFKGKLVSDNKTIVAIKFSRKEQIEKAKREFEMYSHLKAVDNPNIERFGIPNVYYFNEWDRYMVTVFSYFGDGDLIDGFNAQQISIVTNIDTLILFREFVRQSKYVHSRGIRHDDIKLENIMFRKHRSFLIDFDCSSKMDEDNRGGTFEYLSRRYTGQGIRNALDDYESFLYAMCRMHFVPLKWFALEPNYQNLTHFNEIVQQSSRMRNNISDTIAQINERIVLEPLKRVFLKFANETFRSDSRFPDYDGLYDVIDGEIKKFHRPWFTRLTDDQITEAERELIDNPLPDIRKDIADPKEFNYVYDPVNYTRFYEGKRERENDIVMAKNKYPRLI